MNQQLQASSYQPPNFEQNLDRYALLIAKQGLNVQKGQDVYIGSEIIHRDFVRLIVKHAYQLGARIVSVDFHDPFNNRTRILESSSEEYLKYVPPFTPYRYESMLNETSACVRLIGSEYPNILEDLNPKSIQHLEISFKRSLKKYYEEGIGHSKVQWCVAGASTPAWGKRVFPQLSEQEAYYSLWQEIFRICRTDKENCLDLWKEHDTRLLQRAKKLTELKIQTLHFTGPGTDLKVGLSPLAMFHGGSSKSPRGVSFEANLPTEECFTTPDCNKTQGTVRATRPFFINGKLIKNLVMTFTNGEISHFDADAGKESFEAYIHSDPGAKKLGEVALVGIDSPVYQSNKVFEEILYDENAACHIAIGFAYKFCIANSAQMSPEELGNIGCNVSHVHTDMMISSEDVSVTAITSSGSTVPLIRQGKWLEF